MARGDCFVSLRSFNAYFSEVRCNDFPIDHFFAQRNQSRPAGYFCVDNRLYKPDGDYDLVSSCQGAVVGDGYACIGNRLYKPDGDYDVIGSCEGAAIRGGYACAGNRLYKPDGSYDFVNSCQGFSN